MMLSKVSLVSFATIFFSFPHAVSADGWTCIEGDGAPIQQDCLDAASALFSSLRVCEGYVFIPAGTAAHPGHTETVGTCEVWIAATGNGYSLRLQEAEAMFGLTATLGACPGAWGTADGTKLGGWEVGTRPPGSNTKKKREKPEPESASPPTRVHAKDITKRQSCQLPATSLVSTKPCQMRRLQSYGGSIPLTIDSESVNWMARNLATAIFADTFVNRYTVNYQVTPTRVFTVVLEDIGEDWDGLRQINNYQPSSLQDVIAGSIDYLAREGVVSSVNDLNRIGDYSTGYAYIKGLIWNSEPLTAMNTNLCNCGSAATTRRAVGNATSLELPVSQELWARRISGLTNPDLTPAKNNGLPSMGYVLKAIQSGGARFEYYHWFRYAGGGKGEQIELEVVFLAGTGPNNLDRNLQQDPNNDRFIVMHIHFRRKNKNFGIRQINFRHGTELRKVRGGSNPIYRVYRPKTENSGSGTRVLECPTVPWCPLTAVEPPKKPFDEFLQNLVKVVGLIPQHLFSGDRAINTSPPPQANLATGNWEQGAPVQPTYGQDGKAYDRE